MNYQVTLELVDVLSCQVAHAKDSILDHANLVSAERLTMLDDKLHDRS
jgi:hypothetical protein